MFRNYCKAIHRWLAVPFGIFFMVACLTGAILVFEKEITRCIQSSSPETTAIAVPAEQSEHLPFFKQTRAFHRWLFMVPAEKPALTPGRVIMGCNAFAALIILLTGLVMWWPKNFRQLSSQLRLTVNKGTLRFAFSYHRLAGILAVVVLPLTLLTGPTWSFVPYKEAVSHILGNPPKGTLFLIHSGGWGGVPTQILLFLILLLAAFLPLTGYYIWYRRCRKR